MSQFNTNEIIDSILNFKNASNTAEMSEALWKIDKWMPEDTKLQNEFSKIVSKGSSESNITKLVGFFENNMDEEVFVKYAPNTQLKDFAKYVLKSKKKL